MFRTLTLLTLCVALALPLFAQVYNSPAYDYNRTTSALRLNKVEITKQFTIVDITYTNPPTAAGVTNYIFIIPQMCIIDPKTNKKFFVLKTENIPMEPGRHEFHKPYEKLRFKVYFPRIDINQMYIVHILEDVESGFKFYNVRLMPMA